MRAFLAYIRVSTARQGEQGASLTEQRLAISRYAERQQLHIAEWFDEIETAASVGRPLFARVVSLLRQGKAQGLIIHKIDRSMRNYYDWAEVSDLADHGIAVHFAGENLELGSRGRRLQADIQAVFATDYIRNLREEIHKGIDGRLRAGFVPWRAPLGYVDNGGGKVKTICPATGHLVRQAFELYATGNYTLEALSDELFKRGLRNRAGTGVTINGLSILLRNMFYVGLINHRRSGQTYNGGHEPLIPVSLFKEVQDRLKRRFRLCTVSHSFRYRGCFRCANCGRRLIAEAGKGHAYYRCHRRACPTTCVREEALEGAIMRCYQRLTYDPATHQVIADLLDEFLASRRASADQSEQLRKCRLSALKVRQDRLIDGYLEGAIDKETFDRRNQRMLLDLKDLELPAAPAEPDALGEKARRLLGLATSALLSHGTANDAEKRELLNLLTSDRTVNGKHVVVEPSFPYSRLAALRSLTEGGRIRETDRTGRSQGKKSRIKTGVASHPLRRVIEEVYDWLLAHPEEAVKIPEPVSARGS